MDLGPVSVSICSRETTWASASSHTKRHGIKVGKVLDRMHCNLPPPWTKNKQRSDGDPKMIQTQNGHAAVMKALGWTQPHHGHPCERGERSNVHDGALLAASDTRQATRGGLGTPISDRISLDRLATLNASRTYLTTLSSDNVVVGERERFEEPCEVAVCCGQASSIRFCVINAHQSLREDALPGAAE